jgi:hypothetical protein
MWASPRKAGCRAAREINLELVCSEMYIDWRGCLNSGRGYKIYHRIQVGATLQERDGRRERKTGSRELEAQNRRRGWKTGRQSSSEGPAKTAQRTHTREMLGTDTEDREVRILGANVDSEAAGESGGAYGSRNFETPCALGVCGLV